MTNRDRAERRLSSLGDGKLHCIVAGNLAECTLGVQDQAGRPFVDDSRRGSRDDAALADFPRVLRHAHRPM
jgi:hypothetical protein